MREIKWEPDDVLLLLDLWICFLNLRNGSGGPLF